MHVWTNFRKSSFLVLIGLALAGGCYQYAPPPPAETRSAPDQPEVVKPLPPPPDYTSANIAPGYDDVPLVNQRPPEEPRFVDAYTKVGRPRILVFVNRDLAGQTLPVNPNEPLVSVENTRQSTTGIKTTDTGGGYSSSPYDYYSHSYDYNHSFQSTGPGKYQERTDVYLNPGQYDEAAAKSIDYEMIENIMTDWLSASGQVTIISPLAARQRLTDQEVTELQNGRPQMLGEIAQKLQADILVQITAHPSVQTSQGLGIRLIAQALNTKAGQQIAQATVDIPPPLEKTTLNRYTRFVARKLMDGMSNSWEAMASQPPPPPSTQPTNH
jgi:hypothetical protein